MIEVKSMLSLLIRRRNITKLTVNMFATINTRQTLLSSTHRHQFSEILISLKQKCQD